VCRDLTLHQSCKLQGTVNLCEETLKDESVLARGDFTLIEGRKEQTATFAKSKLTSSYFCFAQTWYAADYIDHIYEIFKPYEVLLRTEGFDAAADQRARTN
jgi:hypothetical protein